MPHAIGPGNALDDRVIAKDILHRSGLAEENACLLPDLLTGKELKGLIGQADMLIAERIHSMIGSVGVNTPFLCLGSKTDRRINGIISGMLGLSDNVYFLNDPDQQELRTKFDDVWERKSDIKNELKQRYHSLRENLENKAVIMRSFIH